MSENVVVNGDAKNAVLNIISNLFNGVAYLDGKTIDADMQLACNGGMSKEDRSIRFELANYLMSHMSLIYTGLIANEDFREVFVNAVALELGLDQESPETVEKVREGLKSDKTRVSKGNFVVDLTNFNSEIYRRINSKIGDSFNIIFDKADQIDSFASELSDDDKIDIGFCVSHFMYLIRAFSKNDLFAEYVKSVTHAVQGVFDGTQF